MKPEQALEHARAQAAAMRERGAYGEDLSAVRVAPDERPSAELLLEWAVIEPDLDLVTSTRRLGAPIAAVKRLLVHLLRQYHGQITVQQTRLNVHLMARVAEQQERVRDLEQRVSDLEDPYRR